MRRPCSASHDRLRLRPRNTTVSSRSGSTIQLVVPPPTAPNAAGVGQQVVDRHAVLAALRVLGNDLRDAGVRGQQSATICRTATAVMLLVSDIRKYRSALVLRRPSTRPRRRSPRGSRPTPDRATRTVAPKCSPASMSRCTAARRWPSAAGPRDCPGRRFDAGDPLRPRPILDVGQRVASTRVVCGRPLMRIDLSTRQSPGLTWVGCIPASVRVRSWPSSTLGGQISGRAPPTSPPRAGPAAARARRQQG